uniref:Uncharacterized protein n=1 Tax=Oryza rufipogon TaxID=4529 RepID=A0A0E0P7S3_ORYRU
MASRSVRSRAYGEAHFLKNPRQTRFVHRLFFSSGEAFSPLESIAAAVIRPPAAAASVGIGGAGRVRWERHGAGWWRASPRSIDGEAASDRGLEKKREAEETLQFYMHQDPIRFFSPDDNYTAMFCFVCADLCENS